jgi:hypothetical protein
MTEVYKKLIAQKGDCFDIRCAECPFYKQDEMCEAENRDRVLFAQKALKEMNDE